MVRIGWAEIHDLGLVHASEFSPLSYMGHVCSTNCRQSRSNPSVPAQWLRTSARLLNVRFGLVTLTNSNSGGAALTHTLMPLQADVFGDRCFPTNSLHRSIEVFDGDRLDAFHPRFAATIGSDPLLSPKCRPRFV